MKSIHLVKFGILSILLISVLTSCTDDDYFGSSAWNEIKEFTVPGQSGATVISKENNTVTLSVGNGVDRTELVPNTFEISNFASVTPGSTEARDFTDPVEYVVRAENGIARTWTVTIDEIGENPQLDNSDFNLWYEMSAGIGTPIIYEEPGESEENTIWSTANIALTTYKNNPNTTPLDLEGNNYAAKMVTTPSPVPAIARIAAGTLFTGSYPFSSSNPTALPLFGTPFGSRPSAFRINYVYVPGASNEDSSGNPVGYDDSCDIYVLLEKRDGDSVARIATGWFRDDTNTGTDDWTILEQEIKYGPLSASDPEYEYANIKDGETWADPGDTPTHISVIFSSSAKGDIFEGALDSTLVVDDFELIYE